MKSLFKSNLRHRLLSSMVNALSRIQTDSANLADIHFCYRLLLGRKAEKAGWEHWSQKVTLGMSTYELAHAFLSSPEFHRREKTERPVNVDDFVIYVEAPDHPIARSISQYKTYEPHVTAIIKKILKPTHVFLDIGCHIGWFVLLAASIAQDGKVIGFEPNYANLQLLYRSIVENGFENIVIFPYAVTDRRNLLQLCGGSAYGFVHSVQNTNDDYVQGVAIDEALKDEPKIDVVKIDIEGHEPMALEGMRETVAKHRPIIVCEFHPKCIRDFGGRNPRGYLEALIHMGYALSVIQFDGSELGVEDASDVINVWHRLNQQLGTGDTKHLDLVARPVSCARR